MATTPDYFLRVLRSNADEVGKVLERAKEYAQFLSSVDRIDGDKVSAGTVKKCKAAGSKMWKAQKALLDAAVDADNAMALLERDLKEM